MTYKFKIIFLIIIFALFSCSTVSVQFDSKPIMINNVPFHPQEEYQCGPASIAGVMNYWRVNITPDDIARDIYSVSARGTLTIDMALYAQKKGFYSLYYRGDWEDLKAKIHDGYPLIVLVDYGFSIFQTNHFMVVVGYTEDGIIANSGKKERVFIKKDAFLKAWGKTNFWTLWIKPK